MSRRRDDRLRGRALEDMKSLISSTHRTICGSFMLHNAPVIAVAFYFKQTVTILHTLSHTLLSVYLTPFWIYIQTNYENV